MNSQTIANGIQTLTGIAILFGLALVALELRQPRELARAQLAADGAISVPNSGFQQFYYFHIKKPKQEALVPHT